MVKIYNSIMFRITASFFLLIILITGFAYMYTFNSARSALKETVKDQLRQTANMAAAQFTSQDIDALMNFTKGDESSPAYIAIISKLYALRKDNPDLTEFYSMKKDGDKVYFVVDDWFMESGKSTSAIGDEYTDYDASVLTAFEGKTAVSADFYTDEWGTFLSGNAPLKDRNGNVVGVIGVDMDVGTVQKKINFIGSQIYLIMAVAIFAAVLLILSLTMTISKDINKLTQIANKVSQGELVSELPNIKSKNEIYELNEGIKSIVAAVNLLKDAAEQQEMKAKTKAKRK